jgi:hypothetical protein
MRGHFCTIISTDDQMIKHYVDRSAYELCIGEMIIIDNNRLIIVVFIVNRLLVEDFDGRRKKL